MMIVACEHGAPMCQACELQDLRGRLKFYEGISAEVKTYEEAQLSSLRARCERLEQALTLAKDKLGIAASYFHYDCESKDKHSFICNEMHAALAALDGAERGAGG